MMVHEEQNQLSNNSSGGDGDNGGSGGVNRGGGHRSSKKMKQKKEPQRGLGVAQLEMMRMQDLQKKTVEKVMLSSSQKTLVSSSQKTISSQVLTPGNSAVALPFINYPHNQSSSSIPFGPPSPTNILSPNSVFRPPPPPPSLSGSENFPSNSLGPSFNPLHIGGCNVGWPSIPFLGSASFPMISYRYDLYPEGDNPKLDQLAFRPTSTLPYECSLVGPLPDLMQRMQYQHSSSLVSVSSMNTFHIEPPSNQSYYSNHGSSWREEEKMRVMKRKIPSFLDDPSGPSLLSKFSAISHPISRSDESTSWGNGSNFNPDDAVPIFRESPSFPRRKTEKNSKNLHRDDLSLAPPSITSTHPVPKFEHSPSHHLSSSRDFFTSSESLSRQGNAEVRAIHPRLGGSNQRPFFMFLPESKIEVVATARSCTNGSSEVGENLDLNLKL
ncbi:hypothetical protein Dimus_018890 [Dionaea muscipula]